MMQQEERVTTLEQFSFAQTLSPYTGRVSCAITCSGLFTAHTGTYGQAKQMPQ